MGFRFLLLLLCLFSWLVGVFGSSVFCVFVSDCFCLVCVLSDIFIVFFVCILCSWFCSNIFFFIF